MKSRHAGLLCALLSFSALIGRAEVWQSKQLNFSINLPTEQGWIQLQPTMDMIKVAAASADHKLGVSVIVTPTDGAKMDEKFIAEFKRQRVKLGDSQETSESFVQVEGLPAFCLKDLKVKNGREFYRSDTLVFNGGNAYQISTLGVDADPLTDPTDATVRDIVASFKFLNKTSASSPVPVAKRPSTPRRPTPTPTGPPQLKSIMWIPSRPSAQLDTSFAFEGDNVRGYKVTKIRQDCVELLTPKGATLKLVLGDHRTGK